MAENIPPATVAANGANGGAAGPGTAEQIQSRGLPYYEKLRRELRETLQKKRLMDKNMAALEESIYRFEQSYLEETGAGNIIKGFDNYIKGSSGGSGIGAGSSLGSMTAGGGGGGGGGPTTRRKTQVQDSDRVFSKSSASFMRDSPAPSSTHTTPSHAPTPTSSHPPGAHRDTNNKDTAANNNASAASSVKGGGGGGGGSGTGGSNNKKKKNPTAATDSSARGREHERDEDDEESAGGGGNNKGTVKRLKITYARD